MSGEISKIPGGSLWPASAQRAGQLSRNATVARRRRRELQPSSPRTSQGSLECLLPGDSFRDLDSALFVKSDQRTPGRLLERDPERGEDAVPYIDSTD